MVRELSGYSTNSFELFLDCRKVLYKSPSIISDSDAEETPCFKIKHIESITNVKGTTNSGDNSQVASNSGNDDS